MSGVAEFSNAASLVFAAATTELAVMAAGICFGGAVCAVSLTESVCMGKNTNINKTRNKEPKKPILLKRHPP